MPLWCSGETRQWHSVLRPRRVSDEHPFPKEVLRDIPGVTTRFLSAQEVLEGVQVLQGKPAASAKVYGATEQAWLERMAEERNKRLAAREDDAAGSKSKDAAPRPPTVDILDPTGAGGAARAGKETTKRRPKHRTKPVLASVASLGALELSDDPKTRQAQLRERKAALEQLEGAVTDELSKIGSSKRSSAAGGAAGRETRDAF